MELAPVNGWIEENITAELERGIGGIIGVRGARVMLDAAGEVAEVHVVTSPKRSPKKVVRDIETFFAVCHRRRVDYRRISCVQLSDDVPLQDRPTLRRISCESAGCEVILSDGTHHLVGRAASAEDLLHGGAAATVAALNQLWGDEPRLMLLDTQALPLGQRELSLVYLMHTGRSVEHLTGTSFIRGERSEAAARAVLSAVNRRLRAWIGESKSAGAVASST